MRPATLRPPLLVLAALCLAIAALAPPSASRAQGSPAFMQRDGCRLEGLWQEQSAHWVTRIEGPARWRTWNALPGSESDAPVAHGWLEYTEELLVFDYDGAGGGGYAYDWGFEEGCSVLRLDLARVGTGPPGYQLRYRLRRLAR